MDKLMVDMQAYFVSLVAPDWNWGMVGVDILVVISMLFLFKHTLGMFCRVSVKEEVAEKDNPAFGFVIAMSFLSFFIIMAAASTGGDVVAWYEEIILMVSYGISGILMLLTSKIIFDKVSMSKFHIQEQLNKGNLAAGIVSGGNLIATSMIVFAYMSWVKGTDLDSLLIVLYGFVLSQVLLSISTLIRIKMHNTFDGEGESLQDSIINGNIAVAIRFTGYRLAMAMAPIIALSHYPYEAGYGYLLATEIFLTSIFLGVIYIIGTVIAKKIVFSSIDFCDETNKQKNIGTAWIEFAFVIGIALLNYGLLK
jgi:uncharacterized membrane protein YjfL (UPF0719 family)